MRGSISASADCPSCPDLGPGYTCHTLRHYAATKAYGQSHDVFMVQQILGHTSAATTQRYVKLDDTAMRRWLEAMAS